MSEGRDNQPDPVEPPFGLIISLGVIGSFLFLVVLLLYVAAGAWFAFRF